MKTNYRGFDITLSAADMWFAEISNPATGKAWSQRLATPLNDGSSKALRRAQGMVDAFLALHGPQAA
jgi:hypothetical protein